MAGSTSSSSNVKEEEMDVKTISNPATIEERTERFKPGQKYPTPSQGAADRIFYESLLAQVPDSPMAQDWCVAYGIIEDEKEAKRLAALVQKRKADAKVGIISPPPKATKGAGGKKRNTTTKQKATFVDDIEDGIGESGGNEMVGSIGLG